LTYIETAALAPKTAPLPKGRSEGTTKKRRDEVEKKKVGNSISSKKKPKACDIVSQ